MPAALIVMNTLASLLDLGGPDLIVLLIILLLLFGAKKLPEQARRLGEAMEEFRKARDEFHRPVNQFKYEGEDAEQELPDAEGGENRGLQRVVGWVLVPLAIIAVLSALGMLTPEQVLALVIIVLLFWGVGKMDDLS